MYMYKKTEILRVGEWEGQAMAGSNRKTAHVLYHMTLSLSQVPVVCEKNIFHLFRFTQPVENST